MGHFLCRQHLGGFPVHQQICRAAATVENVCHTLFNGAGGLGLSGIGEGGGGRGEGIGLGNIGTIGHGAGTGTVTMEPGVAMGAGSQVSRVGLAKALLQELETPRFPQQAVYIRER